MTHPKDRFKLLAASYVFLIRNGKIFLLRRFNTGWEDGNYTIPAGHIEEGESAKQAAARETEEETGIKISKDNLRFVHVMHRRSLQPDGVSVRIYVDFFFTADDFEGEPLAVEKEKSDHGAWFPLDAIPDNTVPNIKVAIESYKNNVPFSEFGW